MLSSKLAAALAAFTVIAAPAAADAQSNVRLQLGGAGSASTTAMKTERGVRVYRAAAPLEAELAGGEPAPAAKPATVKVVVVHHHHSRIKRLRTQGFYSGHPGKSRRFTQGFYSGPADW